MANNEAFKIFANEINKAYDDVVGVLTEMSLSSEEVLKLNSYKNAFSHIYTLFNSVLDYDLSEELEVEEEEGEEAAYGQD